MAAAPDELLAVELVDEDGVAKVDEVVDEVVDVALEQDTSNKDGRMRKQMANKCNLFFMSSALFTVLAAALCWLCQLS